MYAVSSYAGLHILNETTGEQIFLVAIPSGAPAASVGPPCPMWMTQHLNRDDEGVITAISAYNGTGLWEKTMRASGESASWPYGPTVAGDMVYVALGSNDGYDWDTVVEGYVSRSGERKFSHEMRADDRWTPTVGDGRLFWSSAVGTQDESALIGELDPHTGALLWEKKTWATDYNVFSNRNVVCFKNDMIYITRLYQTSGYTYNLEVFAYAAPRALNGSTLMWTAACRNPFGEPPAAGVGITLANDYTVATDGKEVLMSCWGGIRAYDAINGTHIGTYNCSCYGQPIMTNDLVIAVAMNGVYVFDRRTRKVKAVVELSAMYLSVAYHGGWMFVSEWTTGMNIGYQLLVDPHAHVRRTTPAPHAHVGTTPLPVNSTVTPMPHRSFPWLIVGLVIGGSVVVFSGLVLLGYYFFLQWKKKYLMPLLEGHTDGHTQRTGLFSSRV